jgi:hypothetical protein
LAAAWEDDMRHDFVYLAMIPAEKKCINDDFYDTPVLQLAPPHARGVMSCAGDEPAHAGSIIYRV